MRELIEAWDGEAVVAHYDRESGAWFFIALYDTTLGMAVGGCRMRSYPTPEDGLRDAMRLAEGMTYKWASIGVPFGGGKSVLAVPDPPQGTEREALLLRFGRLLESLRGSYATGVDMGTTPADMTVVARETSHVLGFVPGRDPVDPGPYTALGVFASIRSVLAHLFDSADPDDRRVLVQGLGDVGLPLVRLLADAEAALFVSDIDSECAATVANELSATIVAPEDVIRTECDIFAPCAIGAVLNPESIERLACRGVAGSANNQLESPADAEALHGRGILYAPDYVANAGGAICFAMLHQGIDDEELIRDRVLGIGDSLDETFLEAKGNGESPVHAARRRAERALSAAPGREE